MSYNNSNGRRRTVDFADVRSRVPLNWFFENMLGGKPKKMPGVIRYSVCPNPDCGASSDHSVKVSVKDDKWKCFACGKLGDVVEAAAMYFGKSLADAALELMGADSDILSHYHEPEARPAVERDDSALAEAFSRLTSALPGPSDECIAYLVSRGIPPDLTREAHRRGFLYSLPSDPAKSTSFLLDVLGYELMFKAGMWREGAKRPGIAYRPLMLLANTRKTAEFRYLRKTTKTELKVLRHGSIAPWLWKGKTTDRILVTEGFIDILSAVALDTERSIFGLPGCENWRAEWFKNFQGKNVLSGLDDDQPGRAAFDKLRPVLEAAVGGPIGRIIHPAGAIDLNDALMIKKKLK